MIALQEKRLGVQGEDCVRCLLRFHRLIQPLCGIIPDNTTWSTYKRSPCIVPENQVNTGSGHGKDWQSSYFTNVARNINHEYRKLIEFHE